MKMTSLVSHWRLFSIWRNATQRFRLCFALARRAGSSTVLISSVHKSTKGIFFFLSVHGIDLKHPPSPHFVESSCEVSVRSNLFYVDCSWILNTIYQSIGCREIPCFNFTANRQIAFAIVQYGAKPELQQRKSRLVSQNVSKHSNFESKLSLTCRRRSKQLIWGDGRDVTCKLPGPRNYVTPCCSKSYHFARFFYAAPRVRVFHCV